MTKNKDIFNTISNNIKKEKYGIGNCQYVYFFRLNCSALIKNNVCSGGKMTALQNHYRNCNLCEAMCGLEIQVIDNKKIQSIKGDAKDPFSKGHICPKAIALQDIHNDPDRLKYPIRRVGNKWEQISWEEAFDEIVEKIKHIQKKYGEDAFATYWGSPNAHNFGSMLFLPLLLKALKTRNSFSATSTDQLPHHLAALSMYGNQMMIPVPDIDRTEFLLIIGGNPLASNGSLMTAPNIAKRLKAIQKRGGKVIVIDPRRTETAKKASRHHFIRPGTDALFLLALIDTIFKEDLCNPGKLAEFTEGFDTIKLLSREFSPENISKHVGISTRNIKELAIQFAQSERAVCYGRFGVCTQEFGGLCLWLINVLNIITGRLDTPGGYMFTKPAFDLPAMLSLLKGEGSFNNRQSRVRKLPSYSGDFPCSIIADEMLTEGRGQIKGFITIAGNPVLSIPNGKALEKALENLEFMVAIDFYLNETTKYAHIILPPGSPLERGHYDIIFNTFAVRNTVKYSPPLFEATNNTRHDWQIMSELTYRLTSSNYCSGKIISHFFSLLAKVMTPEKVLNMGLVFGPYGIFKKPVKGLSLTRLKKHPHGIDLGALEPCLPNRLFTKSKTINLTPETYIKDLERLRKSYFGKKKKDNEFDLLLIGRRQLRSNNSWMHNFTRLVKGKKRCNVFLHPNDAAKLGIKEGEDVKVVSNIGDIFLPAEITDDVMEGVVSMPHGWGHHRKGIRLGIAQQNAGVSLNDIIDHQLVDDLCGTSVLNGVPVKIERISA